MDFEDIPDFLKLTAEERAAARRSTPVTRVRDTGPKLSWGTPKALDAEGKRMLREKERDRRRRERQRLKELAQRRKRA